MGLPAMIGAAVVGALLSVIGSIVKRVLIALGVGFVTYMGIKLTFDQIKGMALQYLNGLPSDIYHLLAYMNVGVAVNIIFSAYVARFVLVGLDKSTGKITKPVFGKKG